MTRHHFLIAELETHCAGVTAEIESLERTKRAYQFDELGRRDHDLIRTIESVQRLLNGAARALKTEAIITQHAAIRQSRFIDIAHSLTGTDGRPLT